MHDVDLYVGTTSSRRYNAFFGLEGYLPKQVRADFDEGQIKRRVVNVEEHLGPINTVDPVGLVTKISVLKNLAIRRALGRHRYPANGYGSPWLITGDVMHVQLGENA